MLFKVQFSESKADIEAKFNSSSVDLDALFSTTNVSLDAVFTDLQTATTREDVDPYMDEYEVTPKVTAQTLPTAQKYMTDDMEIKAIPYFETSNNSDGETVYIGAEV